MLDGFAEQIAALLALFQHSINAFERAGAKTCRHRIGGVVDSLASHGANLADISYSRKVDITYLDRQGDIMFD